MPSSSARKAKPERASKELFENVTNPFCGTLPDDLTVERTEKGLKVLNNGDGKSVAGFERKLPAVEPSGQRQGRRARQGDRGGCQADRQSRSCRCMAGLPPTSKACAP